MIIGLIQFKKSKMQLNICKKMLIWGGLDEQKKKSYVKQVTSAVFFNAGPNLHVYIKVHRYKDLLRQLTHTPFLFKGQK